MKKRIRRNYTKEFNKEADKLVTEQGYAFYDANRTRVGDITYIWTSEGWLYLAVILDLFTLLNIP